MHICYSFLFYFIFCAHYSFLFHLPAHLTYQIMVHFKHFLPSKDTILLFFDVKHIQDINYTPIIIPISNSTDIETAFQEEFIPICENYSQPLNMFNSPEKQRGQFLLITVSM